MARAGSRSALAVQLTHAATKSDWDLFSSGAELTEIFVDADACPVKGDIERVAERHGLVAHIVSNGGIRPSRHPLMRTVIVAEGPDAADDWIVEHVCSGDIVVTADIPLASRCLAKGARVLGHKGKAFTEDMIGLALGMRDLNKYLRAASGDQTYNAGFTKDDHSRFLNTLENTIQAAKRQPSRNKGETS
jgi:uncharacterized protein YaiI (UPF0178 family)